MKDLKIRVFIKICFSKSQEEGRGVDPSKNERHLQLSPSRIEAFHRNILLNDDSTKHFTTSFCNTV
jgi:hypothetical protein